VLQFKWWLTAAYCFVFVIVPLLLMLRRLFKAETTTDFHRLSSMIKMVMFTGILSMVFF
jgi:4-hydroxybenzoate polyprenyltransferase